MLTLESKNKEMWEEEEEVKKEEKGEEKAVLAVWYLFYLGKRKGKSRAMIFHFLKYNTSACFLKTNIVTRWNMGQIWTAL